MKYSTALQYAHDSRTGEPLRDGHWFSSDGRSCVVGAIMKVIMGKDLPIEEMEKLAKDVNYSYGPMEAEITKMYFIKVYDVAAGIDEAALITVNQMRALHGMEPLKDFSKGHGETWSLLSILIILNDGLKWEWPRIITFLESHGL